MGKYAYPLESKWPISFVAGIVRSFASAPGGVNPVGGHTGEDRAAPSGTPVYAPTDGYIEFEQFWLTLDGSDNPWLMTAGGGLTVGLQADGGGPLFIMAHLSATLINRGQRVRKGQLIALTGNSGIWTTGAHLHFEVIPPHPNYNNGTYGRVNPALYCTEYPDQVADTSLGPAGTITTTPQEDDMPDMHTFLTTAAFTGGPTISELFVDVKAACKKVDAIHEAIFNNEGTNKSIIGGESLPSLTNKNDLKILDRLEDVITAIESQGKA
ncbi:M23 family metallopeptidase [Arthrobacter sp. 31Y]|uniref:M23 family metallopeptidase n=1 Tax=Arthrobacter sp. 31Y TaxID=1115632 RepID=UPI000463BF3C|nr:M23 family metallopeptidase [Arthrobacter sp. 31Y]